MKPVIVLVGRPSVGKSTLFNRLTRSRSALVADVPGVTRDRQYGDGRVGERPCLVVDTGGIVARLEAAPATALGQAVLSQTRLALAEADVVILVVDARAGLHPSEPEIARALRALGKPVRVAVNKAEGMDPDVAVAEFHALGLGEPVAVSAEHAEGIGELVESALAAVPGAAAPEAAAEAEQGPRIAVIGRPNVGKSSLVNALLGEERVVVCDQPGTTRDSIYVPLERDGRRYILIDTAGVRRRGRVHEAVEKFSVIKALQAVAEADVAIVVIDATEGVTEQDTGLAGYALEQGRAMVVAVNKWDAVAAEDRERVRDQTAHRLGFLAFARVHYVSALTGAGVGALYGSIDRAYESARRTLATVRLNRVLERAVQANPPPVRHGRRIRPKYAHQGGKNPPRVVVHGNQVGALPAAYRRYLGNAFRAAFGLEGTPLLVECREERNPYAGRPRERGRGPARRKGAGIARQKISNIYEPND